MRNLMNIDQAPEPDYDSVNIDYVGFVDPYAVEGMVVLKADYGKEFHMRAFSGEVANILQVLVKLKASLHRQFIV